MFTGIIKAIGTVTAINKLSDAEFEIVISAPSLRAHKIGDSIAVNGVCLTVVSISKHSYRFYLSGETLACSNFASVKLGDIVNLEPALKLSEGLSGHLVSGHVDFVAKILAICDVHESKCLTIGFKPRYRKYFITKGSVAVNGVALTVNKALNNKMLINIIPHTLLATNLGKAVAGDNVNIEIDMVAKYIIGLKRHYDSN